MNDIYVLYELILLVRALESDLLTGQMACGQINLMIAKNGLFDVAPRGRSSTVIPFIPLNVGFEN